MLDYASLFALATVVREGSFDRAARRLHVTPSAVSQRIRSLEERVGCTLVTRGQPCEATAAGRQLCQHADRVRLLEHELREEMPTLAQAETHQVNVQVAVNADSLATWFVSAAIAFSSSAPAFLQIAIDDEGHTAQWLRSGKVLAAVTADERPAAGCNCQRLGVMRYVAAATPLYVEQHLPNGVDGDSLALAPSLAFNAKDELQQRWVGQLFNQRADLPRHFIPSPHAFVQATLGGMGWGMHPVALIQPHLDSGSLIELSPQASLDVPLYWQQSRIASKLMDRLGQAVMAAAKAVLLQS